MTRVRSGAAWLHLVLAVAVAAGVWLQVYLIGAFIFGAGAGALDTHRDVGFTVHGLEVIVLVAALVAWLPRADLGLSLALAAIGTLQIAFASSDGVWVAALHPLGALVVLSLAVVLVRRGIARARTPRPRTT